MSSQKQPHQNQDGKHHNHQDRSGGPADFFSAMSEKHSASAAEHFPRRQRGGGPLLMKGFRVRSVDAYDGQLIRSNGRNLYSLSSYLGGGVAGVVYQALDLQAKEEVAVKVLNPVGYKLLSSAALQRCVVLKKGQPVTQDVKRMGQEHVWWLRHPNSRQLIAAYKEPRYGSLCELPLPKCIQIFGMPSGLGDGLRSGSSSPSHGPPLLVEDPSGELTDLGGLAEDVDVIPRVPPKYLQWLAARRLICQEISHMAQLSNHANVVRLLEVLELTQSSQSTLFAVMELVPGGELFDHIIMGCGTPEETSARYFLQLLRGLSYCHDQGVCHRDLKPENLLLTADGHLKIADFGLSAAISAGMSEAAVVNSSKHQGAMELTAEFPRRLRSFVGSRGYIAPEVEGAASASQGYDGAKADVWSAGVILYCMLVGSLPFARELSKCRRYARFKSWLLSGNEEMGWFFPPHLSPAARHLLEGLLHPEPLQRLDVDTALRHEFLQRAARALQEEEEEDEVETL